jgi:hypothetical protein
MPIIECACGMVMSVAADEPRCCCIRCGGVELRMLSMTDHRRRTDVRDGDQLRAAARGGELAPLLTPWTVAVAEDIHEAAHV